MRWVYAPLTGSYRPIALPVPVMLNSAPESNQYLLEVGSNSIQFRDLPDFCSDRLGQYDAPSSV